MNFLGLSAILQNPSHIKLIIKNIPPQRYKTCKTAFMCFVIELLVLEDPAAANSDPEFVVSSLGLWLGEQRHSALIQILLPLLPGATLSRSASFYNMAVFGGTFENILIFSFPSVKLKQSLSAKLHLGISA